MGTRTAKDMLLNKWAERIAAVLELHQMTNDMRGVAVCSECRQSWPCRTVRVLDPTGRTAVQA